MTREKFMVVMTWGGPTLWEGGVVDIKYHSDKTVFTKYKPIRISEAEKLHYIKYIDIPNPD